MLFYYLISYCSSIQNSWMQKALFGPLYVGTNLFGSLALGLGGFGVWGTICCGGACNKNWNMWSLCSVADQSYYAKVKSFKWGGCWHGLFPIKSPGLTSAWQITRHIKVQDVCKNRKKATWPQFLARLTVSGGCVMALSLAADLIDSTSLWSLSNEFWLPPSWLSLNFVRVFGSSSSFALLLADKEKR